MGMKDYTPEKGLVFVLFIILQILVMVKVYAQDERFYRGVFTGELKHEELKEKKFKFIFASKAYQLDIDDDGIQESLFIEKRDGLDFLKIVNFEGVVIFEDRFFASGDKSKVYKITKAKLSSQLNVLLVHYYEGKIQTSEFEASARLYLISVDKKEQKLVMTKGPHFFHERELIKKQYWNRDYHINVKDFNNDGVKEVSVSFNHIHRVLTYKGNGQWLSQ